MSLLDGVDHSTRTLVAVLDRFEDAEQALDVRVRDSLGVNTIDFAVLRWVDRVHRRGDATRVGDIAAHFGVSSGSATEIVHRLTRAGLLRRTAHPSDGRVRRLEPTDAASQKLLELVGHVRTDLDALLRTVTEDELQRFGTLLATACDIIERPHGSATT